MIAWFVSVAMLGGMGLFVWFRTGPRQAIAVVALLSMLFPQWVKWDIAPNIWITVQTAATVAMLAIYSLHSQATFDFRLRLCDWALIAMMGVHLASDVSNGDFETATVFRIYGEWFMPYVAGRLAFQRPEDIRWTLPLATAVVLTLAMLGVIESVLGLTQNPFELLFGKRIIESGIASNAANAQRWGLKRAYGPLMHTLYFGVVQVMLMPWILYAGQLAAGQRNGDSQAKGWLWAIPITACGVASSLSRGPFLAIGALVYAMYWVLTPGNRYALGVIGIVAVVAAVAISGPLLDQLDTLTGEDLSGATTTDGEKDVKYTAAGHRKMLFSVYAHPMKYAGLLGYGTRKCSMFPPDVPLIQNVGRVKAVDNAYILFTLRFGYLGLITFTLLGITAVLQFLWLADSTTGDIQVWLAAMAAMVVAMMLMFMLVWMPQDIGYLYLFGLGASSGLVLGGGDEPSKERKRQKRQQSSREQEEEPPMRPVGDAW